MSKVYIVNYSPTINFSSITTLGTPIYCTEGIIKLNGTKLHNLFRRSFIPATSEDYLLLTGSQLVIAVAYAEWTKKFPSSSILIWDKRKEDYVLMNIETGGDDVAHVI